MPPDRDDDAPVSGETLEIGPGSVVPDLSDAELDALRQVGTHWQHAVAGRRAWLRALPVDPELHRFPQTLRARGAGRFAPIEFVDTDDDREIAATESAAAEPSRGGRAAAACRRAAIGAPIASSAVALERMRKLVALPILASDALSSVAYGPQAMLAVLVLAGTAALDLSLAIAGVIVVLMIAVGLSYRQIIKAYPHGGGSYVVAGENLGQAPALIAAAGLLIDYVLTVAVSISAGVAAVTSAIPGLRPEGVAIGVAVIALLLVVNLRGLREAGTAFAAPTYAFVVAMLLLIAVGLVDAADRGFERIPTTGVAPIEGVTLLLLLRAFASGATAMTGIEAISNAVPAFKPPSARNARTVLTVMVGLLVVMFAGLVVVLHLDGIVPVGDETVLSALAHRHFGSGPLYVFVQATTALVLLLAANTAFNGFPRLLSVMARNGHAPRTFLRLGDRLAFSNGAILLALAAALIFVAFDGETNALVPLYAVGVFVAFTFSQSGMVVHWWRRRGAGWRQALVVNAVGAVLSGIVFVIAGVTKFTEGAWVALLLMGLLALLSWRIRTHYVKVREALTLHSVRGSSPRHAIVPRRVPAHRRAQAGDDDGDGDAPEHESTPDQLHHLAVVPIARLDLASLRALAYAASLGEPVLAIHISPSEEEAERFRGYWSAWGDHLPLQIVDSPYRSLVAPTARYVAALRRQRPDLTLTVVLPELVVKHVWHQPLHNGMTRRLRRALRRTPGIVLTTVPFHLPA